MPVSYGTYRPQTATVRIGCKFIKIQGEKGLPEDQNEIRMTMQVIEKAIKIVLGESFHQVCQL